MRLFDIKFNGERIVYELGMQEAMAHYAGNGPGQSALSFLDSYYGFGPNAFELVNGYDCPAYATYLPTSFYWREERRSHQNSICIFEMDAGYPIARHTANNYVYTTKNVHLVVRSVSTLGNYDYMSGPRARYEVRGASRVEWSIEAGELQESNCCDCAIGSVGVASRVTCSWHRLSR